MNQKEEIEALAIETLNAVLKEIFSYVPETYPADYPMYKIILTALKKAANEQT